MTPDRPPLRARPRVRWRTWTYGGNSRSVYVYFRRLKVHLSLTWLPRVRHGRPR